MRTLFAILIIFLLVGCASQATTVQPLEDVKDLSVVATTNILGDVVSRVGGDNIHLSVLLPVGSDPHSFEPNPQDVAKLAGADLVFANGAGLEVFLDNLLESSGVGKRVVYVSEGIDLHSQGDDLQDVDPHVWTDPNNVKIWVNNIERALSQADPANAGEYAANAHAYRAELDKLDAWIRTKVAAIPPENRLIVTDHTLLDYFVEQYGFKQVGAIVPGYSSLAEPTAQELARIEDAIAELGVKAVFVGKTVNPALAERLSQDTGVQLIFFYTGSLSDPDGDAGSYLDYMRYNTNAIVDALR
ncbi:MAG: metal ABC transporter substrate-binding protein [Anaerolineales bacterium]